MLFFIKLLLAHIIGDFVLQPTKWVKDKEKKKIKSLYLYFHIGIHAMLLLCLLKFEVEQYAFAIVFLLISHFCIDVAKLYFQKKNNKRVWFFIDQILHILALVIASLYYENTFSLSILFNDKTVLFFTALSLITHVSPLLIKIIISQWTPEKKKEKDASLAKAGKYIGILERLFIFTFIVTNNWQAIGFLLAAKSVFRFGDLTASKDRKLTEYILIGTLLSFGLAILIGILYSYLITLL
ncbi:DUF3307 domain-containing protein [uncultured Polaribacter sp.]|uniref:DUF3307 domain-containing protein n=1 Tax=uncultured Polaribacter sp. TaxID=174711 RepID=UPI002611C5F3|nr:DUF3307 domain-containing protein [uncultured Polaribacter sp.]